MNYFTGTFCAEISGDCPVEISFANFFLTGVVNYGKTVSFSLPSLVTLIARFLSGNCIFEILSSGDSDFPYFLLWSIPKTPKPQKVKVFRYLVSMN